MTTHSVNFSWIAFFIPCLLKLVYRKLAPLAKHCNRTIGYIWNLQFKKVWNADELWLLHAHFRVYVYNRLPDTKANDEITFTSFTGIMFVKIANKTILLFQRDFESFFLFRFVFVIEFTFHFTFWMSFYSRLIKIKLAIFGCCFSVVSLSHII